MSGIDVTYNIIEYRMSGNIFGEKKEDDLTPRNEKSELTFEIQSSPIVRSTTETRW